MSVVSEGAEFAASGAALGRHEPSIASVGDYVALMKPRVMSLVVFTALVGLMVAPGHVHPVIGFTALLCIAVGAGAAGALNMWYDADIDAVMTRTSGRPIPPGRVAPGEALAFGLALAAFSVVRARPARELARGGAARLHHLLLRRRLHDVAQALDAAEHRHRRRGRRVSADDRLGGGDRRHRLEPLLLFLIIFFWTPPHFWALSLTSRRRLCPRPRADAAGGRRRGGDAPADPALFARARADRRGAVAVRLCRCALRGDRALGRRR